MLVAVFSVIERRKPPQSDELDILVENEGKLSFGGGIAKDFKGSKGEPTLDNMLLTN